MQEFCPFSYFALKLGLPKIYFNESIIHLGDCLICPPLLYRVCHYSAEKTDREPQDLSQDPQPCQGRATMLAQNKL